MKYPSMQDATSNQVIANIELRREENRALVDDAIALAKTLALPSGVMSFAEFVVELSVNPHSAHDIAEVKEDAHRIRRLIQLTEPDFDLSRVCIKIPSTWEGLQACRALEKQGIKTLATTLFSIEQAVLAAEVGCHYVAPYVHELKEQVDSEYCDPHPNQLLVREIHDYYKYNSLRTQLMPASLVSMQECIQFAGVDYLTIAPPLLSRLSNSTIDDEELLGSVDGQGCFSEQFLHTESHTKVVPLKYIDDESAFRLEFMRSEDGRSEAKQVQSADASLWLQAYHIAGYFMYELPPCWYSDTFQRALAHMSNGQDALHGFQRVAIAFPNASKAKREQVTPQSVDSRLGSSSSQKT
ncbi:MAG: hypothetical protein M1828_000484 [Chrysothrix sp. TS-e1954]|nr:MAG: hypothetical protein M1828_000484 [Chrysothrix sp. TS-e1954]